MILLVFDTSDFSWNQSENKMVRIRPVIRTVMELSAGGLQFPGKDLINCD